MSSPSTHDDLLRNLFHELYQTERSAERHSLREADRLGDSPPAQALRAVAKHASSIKPSLHDLAKEVGGVPRLPGKAIGDLFSEIRERALDHSLSCERSYRMTLIGMRHGVDLVRSIKAVAERAHKPTVENWCRDWLVAREQLVEAVAGELDWFAGNPTKALAPARSLFPFHALKGRKETPAEAH